MGTQIRRKRRTRSDDRRGKAKPENELTEDRLRQENKILQAMIKDQEMEIALLKKIEGTERRRSLSGVRQEDDT